MDKDPPCAACIEGQMGLQFDRTMRLSPLKVKNPMFTLHLRSWPIIRSNFLLRIPVLVSFEKWDQPHPSKASFLQEAAHVPQDFVRSSAHVSNQLRVVVALCSRFALGLSEGTHRNRVSP